MSGTDPRSGRRAVRLGIAVAVALSVCAVGAVVVAREREPEVARIAVSSAGELDRIRTEHDVVLVYIHAAWCEPCAGMAPIIDQVARSRPGIAVVRVDHDAAPALAERLHASPLPLLILYLGGDEAGRVSGPKSLDYITAWIDGRSSRR